MDLREVKGKLKSFITRKEHTGSHYEDDESTSAGDSAGALAVADLTYHSLNMFESDPQKDREIIESIEDIYFRSDEIDTSKLELQKLAEHLEGVDISTDESKLRQQLQAVSKKLSALVLENHSAYETELKRVIELLNTLEWARLKCTDSRQRLGRSKTCFTTTGLLLLSNHRKRRLLVGLLKALCTIKTLQKTDIRSRELLAEEDFPGAINLCLECQQVASALKHYACISELSNKLQDTLLLIEEQLDRALLQSCASFSEAHYTKLQTAYRLLGKTQSAMDQLHMHFASTIHNVAFRIVLGYFQLFHVPSGDDCASGQAPTDVFQKRQYKELCESMTVESFIPCLLDLCKALWEVMKSYHQTTLWHEEHANTSLTSAGDHVQYDEANQTSTEDIALRSDNVSMYTSTSKQPNLSALPGYLRAESSLSSSSSHPVLTKLDPSSDSCSTVSAIADNESATIVTPSSPPHSASAPDLCDADADDESLPVPEQLSSKSTFSNTPLDYLSASPVSGLPEHDLEATMQQTIRSKLHQGRDRVWHDIQQKVRAFIISVDLSHFQFDDFIKVLDVINRLIQIGQEFCGSSSDSLRQSIEQQSLNYFRSFHRTRMDELRMFLENEGWEVCPLKSSFTLMHLQEFRFLKLMSNWGKSKSTDSLGDIVVCSPIKFFTRFDKESSPFEMSIYENATQEDFLDIHIDDQKSDESSSENEDATDGAEDDRRLVSLSPKKSLVTAVSNSPAPNRTIYTSKPLTVLTNTALNILRLVGKYIQMINVLRPITYDVVIRLTQLFDFYVYSIYCFFARGACPTEIEERFLGTRLRATLRRIERSLIVPEQSSVEQPLVHPSTPTTGSRGNAEAGSLSERFVCPKLSAALSINAADRLYGLPEKMVAVESIRSLSSFFQQLRPHLEMYVPKDKKPFLDQFYSQTVHPSEELAQVIYYTVAVNGVNFDSVRNQMVLVRWDVRDIMSQHNAYVDSILKEFDLLLHRLSVIAKKVTIPRNAYDILWQHTLRLANRLFVDGFASGRKCTNEGRALMHLDYQQYLLEVEKRLSIKANDVPDRAFVDEYIRAYYLPETQLKPWIQNHLTVYSVKQLSALVNSVPQLTRKGRQGLLQIVDETAVSSGPDIINTFQRIQTVLS